MTITLLCGKRFSSFSCQFHIMEGTTLHWWSLSCKQQCGMSTCANPKGGCRTTLVEIQLWVCLLCSRSLPTRPLPLLPTCRQALRFAAAAAAGRHCTDTLGAKHHTWAKHGAEAKADNADTRLGRDGSACLMRVGWASGVHLPDMHPTMFALVSINDGSHTASISVLLSPNVW